MERPERHEGTGEQKLPRAHRTHWPAAQMTLEYFDFHIGSNISLLVITALLAAGTLASFWRARGSIEPDSLPL